MCKILSLGVLAPCFTNSGECCPVCGKASGGGGQSVCSRIKSSSCKPLPRCGVQTALFLSGGLKAVTNLIHFQKPFQHSMFHIGHCGVLL